MSGDNAALSAFVVTEKSTAAKTRTISFTAANSKIKSAAPKHIVEGEQQTEITVGTYGTVTYSGWA
jgi:hypothetical protein